MTEFVEKTGALTTDSAAASASYTGTAAPSSFLSEVQKMVPPNLVVAVEDLTNTAFSDVVSIIETAIVSFVSADAPPFAPIVSAIMAAITPLLQSPISALQNKVDALEKQVFGGSTAQPASTASAAPAASPAKSIL